jgi:hypothetical protein
MALGSTLLDEVLPEYDFVSRHGREVRATPEEVARAVERYHLTRDASPLVRLLFRLRGLRIPSGSVRAALSTAGFTVIAERPGQEIVVGTIGRFWTLREQANMEAPADLDAFRRFARPGWAKGAASLRFEPRHGGWTNLLTETRVQCVDVRARRCFALYWMLIKAFSGWIRRDLLRGIARMAEEASERTEQYA